MSNINLPDLKQHFSFLSEFGILIYGSWWPLDRFEILSRGAPTFSTPGKAIPRLSGKSIFVVPRGVIVQAGINSNEGYELIGVMGISM